jgi:hypothetical protein
MLVGGEGKGLGVLIFSDKVEGEKFTVQSGNKDKR